MTPLKVKGVEVMAMIPVRNILAVYYLKLRRLTPPPPPPPTFSTINNLAKSRRSQTSPGLMLHRYLLNFKLQFGKYADKNILYVNVFFLFADCVRRSWASNAH